MADENETARLSVILPTSLRVELEQLAERNERPLSGEVRLALREHVQTSGVPGRAT
jgi:hypothetical protein